VVGLPVSIYTKSKIVGVGINDLEGPIAKFYPNPVRDRLFIEPMENIDRIVLLNITGQIVRSMNTKNTAKIEIYTGDIIPGIYFMKLYARSSGCATYKIIVL